VAPEQQGNECFASVKDRAVTPWSSLRRKSFVASVIVSWVAVLAVSIVCLEQSGAPLRQDLMYVAAWIVGCMFPGVMVWRAVAGHSTIVRELGFGGVLGIPLQLVVWAVAVAVHRPVVMWLLPAGVVVAFTLVPGLRRHWWPARAAAAQTPARWHAAMAVVIVLALARIARLVLNSPALPPSPSVLSRDTWYNSAIAYEVDRTLLPQDPFVVGEPLRYHWFSDAHVAATAKLAGVPIVNAMVTLWLVPMVVVLLLATAAAAQHLLDGPRPVGRDGRAPSDVRRWWVGPLAAFFFLVAPGLWRFGRPPIPRVGDGFVGSSPSGILAMALIVCLAGPVLDVARGRAHRGTWAVLVLLLAVSAGTKPSILPVVLCGAVLVLAVDLIQARRLNRPMVAVSALAVALMLATYPVLAGSTGGSHFQLFAYARLDPSYTRLLHGTPELPGAGTWLLPALAKHLPGAVPIVGMLLLIWLLTETPRLLALVGLGSRPIRRDLGTWWICGVLASGYAGMWSLSHPGFSQHYFWSVTIALAITLTVANAVRVLPEAQRGWELALPLVGFGLLGVLAAIAGIGPRVALKGAIPTVVWGRLRPYAIVLLGLAIIVVLVVLLRRFGTRWSVPLLTAVTAFALCACLPGAYRQVLAARPPRLNPLPEVGHNASYVSPEQQRAATWLRQHTDPNAVVATNIFCWPMGTREAHCRHNLMWLSGISGRRTVLSDWTYSAASLRRYNATIAYTRLSSPWPDREQLSIAAVVAPTPENLGQLRTQYSAQWIFADNRATAISTDLARLATLAYHSAHISIYRLRDRY
jgi:hypothetical protein